MTAVARLQPIAWIARLGDDDVGEMPPYTCSGTVTAMGDYVTLEGFSGVVQRRHVVALMQKLESMGFTRALCRRAENRRMPFARLIESGDLAGWLEIPLERFRG